MGAAWKACERATTWPWTSASLAMPAATWASTKARRWDNIVVRRCTSALCAAMVRDRTNVC
eukprot:7421194-Pyramimonas_sp.AAC.1